MVVSSTEGEASASVPQIREANEQAAVLRAESLENPVLYFESKRKLLELLRVFADHGYVSLEDVAAALDRSSELASPLEAAVLREHNRTLEESLREAKFANDLIAWEREEAELALRSERDLVKESLVRIASLEDQLKDARRTTLKLIAASKNGLTTLKHVQQDLASQTFAVTTLAPLVRDFRELTQVVQELQVLAAVRPSGFPVPLEGR